MCVSILPFEVGFARLRKDMEGSSLIHPGHGTETDSFHRASSRRCNSHCGMLKMENWPGGECFSEPLPSEVSQHGSEICIH